jgi:hypothetical protein
MSVEVYKHSFCSLLDEGKLSVSMPEWFTFVYS